MKDHEKGQFINALRDSALRHEGCQSLREGLHKVVMEWLPKMQARHPRDLFTSTKNQLTAARTEYQGDTHKVLCICSAGVLRSPTAARVLQEKFGYNTRAAGMEAEYAIIPISEALLAWCDEIVCFQLDHMMALDNIKDRLPFDTEYLTDMIKLINIDDDYNYMNEDLVQMILDGYKEGRVKYEW